MINFVAIVLLFLSGLIVGAQEPEVRTLQVYCLGFGQGSLHYSSKELVDYFKELGVSDCNYNTPFLKIASLDGKFATKDEQTMEQLQALPFAMFVDPEDDTKFKKYGSQLCTLTSASGKYKVIFKYDASGWKTGTLLCFFQHGPNYNLEIEKWLVNEGNDSNRYKVKNFLLEQGILEERDGKIVQGPNGYFAKEYAQEKRELEQQQKTNSALVWRRRVLLGACGMLFLWLVYKSNCWKYTWNAS